MKVSVIVPIWNSSEYIGNCIQSLKEQTVQDFEVIFIVDSRTTDQSESMLRSVNDLNMKIIRQTDDGRVGSARNIGLKEASGQYIWFLDVDDTPMSSYIEKQLNIMEKTGADISACNFIYHYKGTVLPKCPESPSIIEYDGLNALLKINEGKLSTNVWDKLFKCSLIREHNIHFERGYSEDYHFVSEACLHSKKIAYTSEPLYIYNLNNNSRSSSKGNEIATKDVEIFEHYREVIKNQYPESYQTFCQTAVRHIIRSLTMTDWETFKTLKNRESIASSIKMCKTDSAEMALFKISPKMYHIIGSAMRTRKYSKKSFVFNTDY